MNAHVEANADDQNAGEVRCTTSNAAQLRPTIGGLSCPNGRSSTHSDQGNCQADAEAQDEHASQRDLFNLKTEQQDGNGSGQGIRPPVRPNMTIWPVVTSRLVKRLTCWSKPHVSGTHTDQGCKQVFLRGLAVDDLFDDFFAPISRDGAALLEVNVRLLKALISLAEINPAIFKDACDRHVDLLMTRAETTLALQHEKDQLSSLARTMTR